MKIIKFLWLSSLILCGANFAFGQTAQVIYDPMKPGKNARVSSAEERLIERNALPKARSAWKSNEACGEDFQILDAARGSFTRKNSAQKAFLYEFCQTGNGFANNGLVLVENGVIIAHFIEAGGWNVRLRRLPDINKNDFDELVVETSGGMHQGFIGGSVTLIEITPNNVRELGSTRSFSNECDRGESGEDCDKSYKITVAPGAKPVFYKEKFVNVGDDMKSRWQKRGKSQKVSLNKTASSFKLLK